MIDLVQISKSYTTKNVRKPIFNRLSFSFPRDRNVAIMGPNGAGKSTLMRLLAGTEAPDYGYIRRYGKLSWPLGFSGGFNGSMSGMENIRFVARIYGRDVEAMVEYVGEFSELGTSLNLPVRSYSSGMKARLAFGMSLAIDFDCYLIDEVIAVGDERFKQKSKREFRKKLPRAKLIMISHSMAQIAEYCDCGLFISANIVEYFDTIEGLVERYKRHGEGRPLD